VSEWSNISLLLTAHQQLVNVMSNYFKFSEWRCCFVGVLLFTCPVCGCHRKTTAVLTFLMNWWFLVPKFDNIEPVLELLESVPVFEMQCMSVMSVYLSLYSSLCLCVCVSMSEGSLITEFLSSSSSSVKCLAYSSSDNIVYVVLSSGRMVVCNGTVTSSRSPVRTECNGNGRPIHCIAVRSLDTGLVLAFCSVCHCCHCLLRLCFMTSELGILCTMDCLRHLFIHWS